MSLLSLSISMRKLLLVVNSLPIFSFGYFHFIFLLTLSRYSNYGFFLNQISSSLTKCVGLYRLLRSFYSWLVIDNLNRFSLIFIVVFPTVILPLVFGKIKLKSQLSSTSLTDRPYKPYQPVFPLSRFRIAQYFIFNKSTRRSQVWPRFCFRRKLLILVPKILKIQIHDLIV